MKLWKSRSLAVGAAVAVGLALVTAVLSVLGYTGPIRSVLKTVAHPFEWVGSRAADAVNGFVSVFTDYDRLREENQELKEALDSMQDEAYDATVLREENAWLKEYLKLAGDRADFDLTDARVIARESGNYATVLTLDRGRVHGVKAGMPVITEDGVFGCVKEAGLDWCKVVSIVETSSSVGAYTERTGALGVVKGDVDLREGGTCLMQYTKNADIRIGDRVYTAGGSESNYPSGLLLGEIVSIEADDAGLTVEIRPAVDFTDIDSLTRLMIVCGYGAEG